ncbi:protein shortage in chiasmata 1 ortholog isoform X2 [Strigops habroptila]|nr:protein shortage in chiasmata 1 ortholog isoform X2 [Strigops habroptila]
MIAILVLDQWKQSLPVEDFLEKKPICSVEFNTNNELIEFIPSSNPSSQTDTEELFLLTKDASKEESTQEKCLKTDYDTEYKEQWQDLYMEEELFFIDNLENYRKKLPSSSVLLSRLHFFLVKDPLLDSEGQSLTEENVFRECLTFQNETEMEESKKELQGIKENFCTVSVKDEEYFMLPIELEFCTPSNGRSDSVNIPSYFELKELLNLAPETMADEDMCKEVIKEAKYIPYLKDEMEVPLSPPCRQQRSWVNFLATGLQEEPIPLSGNSILITEPSREYLQSLVWQSEKYRDNMNSLLLVGWLEEINSMTNQELLSAEKHQSDKVINLCMSLQTQRQHFAMHMGAASPTKIPITNTSVEELTGGSIKKNKVEEEIYFLNQEKKTPKLSESVTSKDMSSEEDNLPSSEKPASFALVTKWDNDSDLSNFIMLRSKCALTQREEKNYVNSPEKVSQPEEQHRHVHEEDSSVCETVRIEEKQQENEDNITVNIQASESQCQAYCLLEEAATPVLEDLTHLSVLASVNWRFDSIKFDHTRFFLKQQEKVICDRFKEGEIDEKEIMLFRHAALVHLLVAGRDLLLTCGLDTALGYLSKAKDIYKNILESCLNNIWRQLKTVQYSSQKKHETNPKITELQCQMLNWMQSCGEKHSVKILTITRMDSERGKDALIHALSKIEENVSRNHCNSFLLEVQIPYVFLTTEGLLNMPDILQLLESKYSITFVERSTSYSLRLCGSTDQYVVLTIDECTAIYLQSMEELNYEKSCENVILKLMVLSLQYTCCWIVFYSRETLSLQYSLRGDTLLNLVLIYAALIELTQKSEDFEVKHFSDIRYSYSRNAAAPLETAVKGALPPEKQNNFNTFYPDYKQNHQSLELLGTSHVSSEALIPPLNPHQVFFDCDAPSYLQKKSCSSEVVTGRKQNFFAVPKDCEDFAHLDVMNSLHVQRQPVRMRYSSGHSSKNSEKENFFATFSDCEPQENSQCFLEEFRDTTFKSPEIPTDQTPWNDSSPTGPCDSFAPDGFLSDFFVDPKELQSLSFLPQIGREPKEKRKQCPPFLWTKEKNRTDSGFAEVPEFKKRRLTYERVPGRSDGQTRLKFF